MIDPAASAAQRGDPELAAEEHPFDVDVEGALDDGSFGRGRVAVALDHDTGVVEEDVHAAELALGERDQVGHLRRVGDIDGDCQGRASGCAYVGDRVAVSVAIDVGSHHRGPFGRKAQGRGPAHAASRACDDRSLASESHRLVRSARSNGGAPSR